MASLSAPPPGALAPSATLGSGAVTGSIDMPKPHQKTMSDRVLAAIALERVTGMKPDPARFVE